MIMITNTHTHRATNRISATVRVTSVRSRGTGGGCIFAGPILDDEGDTRANGRPLVVVAAYDVIGDGDVRKGELWHVSGTLRSYAYEVNGYRREEEQLVADVATLARPSGENIVASLADHPDFSGIGYVKARKLWDAFGDGLYRVLDAGDVESLGHVLSREVAENLAEQWRTWDQGTVVRWLDCLKIPRAIGRKVVAYYGAETRRKIEDDPYRLIAFEADWSRVDEIARVSFDMPSDDPRRLSGALEEALYRHLARKHTAATDAQVEDRLVALLSPRGLRGSEARVATADARALAARAIASGVTNGAYVKSADHYHPTGVYLMEQYLAERFAALRGAGVPTVDEDAIRAAAGRFRLVNGHDLNSEQRAAVRLVVNERLGILTGGAGVGKTTVLRVVCDILEGRGVAVIQMALAGRAARRLRESTGREAMTIARFLSRFGASEGLITDRHCIVIDEASMVDVLTMHAVMRTIPEGARLILIGDAVQLPPIGPGLVFHALVTADGLRDTTARLTTVQRQRADTGIPSVAAAVRAHQWPALPPYAGPREGVSFLRCPTGHVADMAARVIDVYEDLGGDTADVRMLCPTIATGVGTDVLNSLAQERYRTDDAPVCYRDGGGRTIMTGVRRHDRVMWTRNDYVRDLTNGTLGRVVEALPIDDTYRCVVDFEGARHKLTLDDLDDLATAYAITVHKAQGSEFERVIIPVFPNRLLDQSLLYTALTRGVRQVVFVGDKDVASTVVRAPARATQRQVGFTTMLTETLNDR